MRNSFNNNNIKLEEFEALIKLTAEMAKFLYPYIRQILQSRDDLIRNPKAWNEFKNRYLELINERFNTNSMKVKRLLNPRYNDEFFVKNFIINIFIKKSFDLHTINIKSFLN